MKFTHQILNSNRQKKTGVFEIVNLCSGEYKSEAFLSLKINILRTGGK